MEHNIIDEKFFIIHLKLTNKSIHSDQDHDKRRQVEAKHLKEFKYFALDISSHPFHRQRPKIMQYVMFNVQYNRNHFEIQISFLLSIHNIMQRKGKTQ